jgi:hypothetical protein
MSHFASLRNSRLAFTALNYRHNISPVDVRFGRERGRSGESIDYDLAFQPYRSHLYLMESLELLEERRRAGQLALLCPCGKHVRLKRLGCCRTCYNRRQHSLLFWWPARARVVRRDRFRCQGCGADTRLTVHHRSKTTRMKY